MATVSLATLRLPVVLQDLDQVFAFTTSTEPAVLYDRLLSRHSMISRSEEEKMVMGLNQIEESRNNRLVHEPIQDQAMCLDGLMTSWEYFPTICSGMSLGTACRGSATGAGGEAAIIMWEIAA